MAIGLIAFGFNWHTGGIHLSCAGPSPYIISIDYLCLISDSRISLCQGRVSDRLVRVGADYVPACAAFLLRGYINHLKTAANVPLRWHNQHP